MSAGEGPSSGRPRAPWIEEEKPNAKRCRNWIRACAGEMTVKTEMTMSVGEVPSGGGANPKPEMSVIDWILSGFNEGPCNGREERAGEGVAKRARRLPHVCDSKCLATTERGRGSGEGVEDLISDAGNYHDDGEESKWHDTVREYVKPEVDNIMEEMCIFLKKATFMRRYKFVAEQNLQPMKDALDVFSDTLVAFEEAAKKSKP